jgi:tetratricopeptide (TPR) repeat protein
MAENVVDPDNPVAKLCAAGMQAEGQGDPEKAQRLFLQAWEAASDAFEACIAAHYVARHQPNPEETLRWDQVAFRLARAGRDDRTSGFFPSLLLNLAHSYELLGDKEQAKQYYQSAMERAKVLPPDQYGNMVRDGISRGLQRVIPRTTGQENST